MLSRRKDISKQRYWSVQLQVERLEDRLTPATYTWDNAANTLAIHLDTNESLTVTETGGNVAFALSTGSFTQSGGDTAPGSGGPTITINNADLVSSVSIDNSIAAAGTNNVTFSGAGALSSATIEVSITDPDAVGTLAFNGGFDLSATTGGITLQSRRNIVAGSGTALSSTSGDIMLQANQGINTTAGDFVGIDINNATIGGTTGAVTLQGRGGDAVIGSQHGVYIHGGAAVGTETAGSVTIVGNGGNTTGTGSFNHGVYVTGTNSQITSNGGDVAVTGTGGGDGGSDENYGVFVEIAGRITAGGSGSVTVVGNGGKTTGTVNVGVYVTGTNSQITSNGGNVAVTGTGGGAGSSASNSGLRVDGAGEITAGGSGSVTVVGTGGNITGGNITGTGGSNVGVYVTGTNSQITSNGGNVAVTGTGGGAGSSTTNYGVHLAGAAEITAGGSGSVTVTGTGGNTTGGNNFGVVVVIAGRITAEGSGTVTVIGNGGNTTGSNNHGVFVTDSNSQISAGSGGVNIFATTGGGPFAFKLTNSGAVSTAGTGNITIAADSMNLDPGTSVNVGVNTVTLRQKSNNTAIDLGGADAAGTLGLTDAELDLITTGTLIIGNSNSGPITLSAAITRPASTNVELHSGAAIVFNPGSLNTAGGTLLLDPDFGGVQPITAGTDATASTVSFASDLSIAINGTAVDTGYNQLNVSGTVNLTGLDLLLSGSYLPAIGNVFTIVSATSVGGQFNGLSDGTVVTFNGKTLKIAYTATAVTLSAENQAPQANAGGPYVATEGNGIVLDGSGSSDPDDDSLVYSWDLNGDNVFGDAQGVAPVLSWAELQALGIDDGPGQFAVRVRVDDGNGHVVDSPATTLTIDNASPDPSITGPVNGVRGQPRSFVVSAVDPSATDQAAGFTYSISWGDGSPLQAVAATPGNVAGVALAHVYAHVGTFFIQVTATDKDGGQHTVTHSITISAVALQTDPREPSKTALIIGGTVGNDAIIVRPVNLVGAISVVINGTSHGNFRPTGRIIVYAQDGNDSVEFRSRRIRDRVVTITRPGLLHGGGGNDLLDVWGSSAANAILGGDDNDTLLGGAGRDLLIGGMGRDVLRGRLGQDILVDGSTIHDSDDAALCALMAEWARRDVSFDTRIRHLTGSLTGSVNAPYFLNRAVVLEDQQADLLDGGPDRNWLLSM